VRKKLALLLALVALAGGGAAGAWWMQPRGPRAPLPARPPDDDLQLLVSLFDASEPREPPHDRLASAAGELVLARARDGAVLAFPADGGAPRTVASLDGPAWGLAIAGGTLFLSTSIRARSGDGRRAGSTSALPPVGGPAPSTGATGSGPRAAVVRVALAGGPPRVVTEALAHPRALASDGHWVFAVDVDASEAGLLRHSTIVRLSADGGPPWVLARSEGEVDRLALDGANLYWADPLDGAIRAVPKAGGETRTLAAERGLPEQLVLSGDALAWVERRSETVFTMPASGGTPRAIAQDFAGFASLVVDRRGAWWTPTSAADGRYRVLFAPLAGGDSQLAGDSAEPIDALASDGVHLYWARDGEVSRADAPPSPANGR
jgi:hypothetical protein